MLTRAGQGPPLTMRQCGFRALQSVLKVQALDFSICLHDSIFLLPSPSPPQKKDLVKYFFTHNF